MSEKYTRADHEAYRQKVEAEQVRESQERRERIEREAALRAWVADGGNERSFEREWPTLRDEMRRRRVIEADERSRSAQQATGVSRI
jgi:hypothetical protein